MQSPFNNLHQIATGHADQQPHHRETASDAVDSYFSCITTCSLDDGECVTRCVEELREQT
jgi:hypothetical protein